MPGPSEILKGAIRAVPAVRYALGVGGVVAVIALVRGLNLGLDTAVFGAVVMFVLMTVLVIFARLASIASTHFKTPALIFTWFCLILTMASAALLFSHVFFGFPASLNLFRPPEKPSVDLHIPVAPASLAPESTSADRLEIEKPGIVALGVAVRNKPTSLRLSVYPEVEAVEVMKGGPGDAAGIIPGDILETVGGRPVQNERGLSWVEETFQPETPVEVTLLRGTKQKKLRLTVVSALSLYRTSCQNGDAFGCTSLGFLLSTGRGTRKDIPESERLFQIACEQKYMRGCYGLALSMLDEKDYQHALAISQIACSGHEVRACSIVGFLYERGFGVNKDPSRGLKTLQESCDQFDSWGCYQLALAQLESGETRGRASDTFSLACNLGNSPACGYSRPTEELRQQQPQGRAPHQAPRQPQNRPIQHQTVPG
jgi:hypothetical protein